MERLTLLLLRIVSTDGDDRLKTVAVIVHRSLKASHSLFGIVVSSKYEATWFCILVTFLDDDGVFLLYCEPSLFGHARLSSDKLESGETTNDGIPGKDCLAVWTGVFRSFLGAIAKDMGRILGDAFDKALDQIGFRAVFLFIAKQSFTAFGAIDADGLIRIHHRPTLGFGMETCCC